MVALLGSADIESRAPGPFDALVVAGADCTARPAKEGLQETSFLWWVNCTGCTWLFESWDCLTTLLVFERTILHVVREYDFGTWIFLTSLDINCELLSCSILLESCLRPTAKEFLACIPFLTDCEPSVFCIFAGADCAGSSGSVASVQSAKTPLPSWICRLNDLYSSRSGWSAWPLISCSEVLPFITSWTYRKSQGYAKSPRHLTCRSFPLQHLFAERA